MPALVARTKTVLDRLRATARYLALAELIPQLPLELPEPILQVFSGKDVLAAMKGP